MGMLGNVLEKGHHRHIFGTEDLMMTNAGSRLAPESHDSGLHEDDAHYVLVSPERLCLYRPEYYESTLEFFNDLDILVFASHRKVVLDFSKLKELTAAASLMLFAKITRCQCCTLHANRGDVIRCVMPEDKSVRGVFRRGGLWAAIKPGGESKLDRLWDDWSNPYKTGNAPSEQMADIIRQLLQQVGGRLPRKIVSALQESYLNIAHHAYERFKDEEIPLHRFMVGRWWQFVKWQPDSNELSVVIYDMGVGIPDSLRSIALGGSTSPVSDCRSIALAMKAGVTRFNVQGRGRGFNDIRSPIDLNVGADYLLVFSGQGLVVYKKGEVLEEQLHDSSIGGTLIEWTFSGIGK